MNDFRSSPQRPRRPARATSGTGDAVRTNVASVASLERAPRMGKKNRKTGSRPISPPATPSPSVIDAAPVAPSVPQALPGGGTGENVEAPATWRLADYCLLTMALAAGVAVLRYAQEFFIPVMIGVIISYTLRPLVDGMERRLYVPRALGAALLLLVISGGTIAGAWNLRTDVVAFSAELPDAARRMRDIVKQVHDGPPGIVTHLQRAATELEQAANEAVGSSARSVAKAPVAASPALAERAQAMVAQQLGKLMSIGGTLGLACLLAYLLLCSGNEFRRKLLRMVGGTLAKKKVTVAILEEINVQMQRYLLGTALLNVLLGLATWGLFSFLGIERAALWGVIAALLHLIPYAGTGIFIVITFLLGIIEMGGLAQAFYLTVGWFAVQFAIGFGLSTWIQSRSAGVNGAALFVGVVFFGWLWGGWGLIVAVPVLAAVKAIADRVPDLESLSTLLG